MTHPIVLDKVSRWYGPVIGLNEVSLAIGTGVTGLLGPNGAGKSTLLRLVTGQISPSLGEVRVFGEPAFQNQNVLARIGYCPDIERFQDEWTGYEFVRAMAYLSGLSARESARRALEVLEQTGLRDAAHRRLGGYSKGMRQRAKLAQALVHEPELLVMDEPLTGMDPLARRETVDLVRRFGNEGRSVLVSSHVLHEVEAMTDHVILIHHGRVLAEGRVHEIRSLLKGYPHHVTVESRDPKRLASDLLARVDLDGVRLDGNRVTVETRRPSELFEAVESLVLDEGLDVDRMYTRDDSLEAVFDYLVR